MFWTLNLYITIIKSGDKKVYSHSDSIGELIQRNYTNFPHSHTAVVMLEYILQSCESKSSVLRYQFQQWLG